MWNIHLFDTVLHILPFLVISTIQLLKGRTFAIQLGTSFRYFIPAKRQSGAQWSQGMLVSVSLFCGQQYPMVAWWRKLSFLYRLCYWHWSTWTPQFWCLSVIQHPLWVHHQFDDAPKILWFQHNGRAPTNIRKNYGKNSQYCPLNSWLLKLRFFFGN